MCILIIDKYEFFKGNPIYYQFITKYYKTIFFFQKFSYLSFLLD